ncbi:Fe-S cluster assembly protein SufD [Alphaproteobacteria bacterium]|nr:Fe-S cluster assembly protein SufD [Alphaproteobacteria bacterium]
MNKEINKVDNFLDLQNFDSFLKIRRKEASWLREKRKISYCKLKGAKVPSKKVENWKYTDLKNLSSIPFILHNKNEDKFKYNYSDFLINSKNPRIVFRNGKFDKESSNLGVLNSDLYFASISETILNYPELLENHINVEDSPEDDFFSFLNSAYFLDGFVLVIKKNLRLNFPIEVIFLGEALVDSICINSFSLIIAEEGSEVNIVEKHFSNSPLPLWSNSIVKLHIKKSANVKHFKHQSEHLNSYHISKIISFIEDNGYYESFILSTGSRLSRNTVISNLNGVNASSLVNSIYLIKENQHSDLTTSIKHNAPYSKSSQNIFGVVEESSNGVFQGKINVKKNAQKVDASQLSRGLLLSDSSQINYKPELEIYADDVKCSHGSTIGELDEDQLFYLRSRGVDKMVARQILIAGFINEALNNIFDESIRDYFFSSADKWIVNNL